jgi:single stranded DNA-binding protein
MPSKNQVRLLGHVGKDPKIETSKSGHTYAKFSIATNRYAKKGEDKKTDWHSVTVWNWQNWFNIEKGDLVEVQGEVQYREYDGKYYTDIVCRDFTNMDYKKYKGESKPVSKPQQQEGFDEDVPF